MTSVFALPRITLICISGSLLGVGFLFAYLWPLALVGIWVCIKTLEQSITWKSRFGGAVLIFSIKALCGIAWFWSVYPIDWLAIPVSTWQLPAIGLGWLVSGISLGVGGVVLGIVIGFATQYVSIIFLRYALYAVGWIGAEILGSFIFSLVTYGEGGTITTAFSFGYIGYLSAHIPLLFIFSALGGIYGITVTTIFLVLASAYGMSRINNVWRSVLAGVVIGGIVVSTARSTDIPVPTSASSNQVATIALVDTSFTASLNTQSDGFELRQQALTQALVAARESGATYIIFPEDSGLLDSGDDGSTFALIDFVYQLQADGIVVIDSGSFRTQEGIFLRSTILDGKTVTRHILDKQYLVPVGEFVPTYIITPLFTALGWGSVFTALESSVRYRPGPQKTLASELTHIPGVLFCFEGVNPQSVKKLRARSVPFIAHPFSHGWFQSTALLTPQLTMMLRIQARANNISIVSAGNQGTGAVYLPNGQRYVPTVYAESDLWRVRVATIPIR